MTEILDDPSFPFDQFGATYLRLAFTAYWSDSEPSAEIFYLQGLAIRLTLDSVAELEKLALDAMVNHNGRERIIRVIYLGNSLIEVAEDDLPTLGWRLLTAPADSSNL
jgi:hypothetical protein